MPDIIDQIKEAMEARELANVYYTLIPRLIRMHDEGLIPVLPCKVGDTVWKIENGETHQFLVRAISITPGGRVMIRNFSTESYGIIGYGDEVGKTVFLTRESAEAALQERET